MKILKLAEKLSDAEVKAARDKFEMDYYPDYWEWQLRQERESVLALLKEYLHLVDSGNSSEFKQFRRKIRNTILQLEEATMK